jgi:hypothetical protein
MSDFLFTADFLNTDDRQAKKFNHGLPLLRPSQVCGSKRLPSVQMYARKFCPQFTFCMKSSVEKHGL